LAQISDLKEILNPTKTINTEGTLDFEKFDSETQNRIKSYFHDKKTGKTELTFSLEQLKNIA
jgi:uncharacterized iron-regulated protein